MRNTLLITCYFCCLSLLRGNAQEIAFSHLTTENGLSHNTIMSIYEDERGFLWIGSRNGVNVYNGKEIKIYKHEKNNPNSLHYNNVIRITGNRKGKIYCMTSKGVSEFDIQTEKFTTLIQQDITNIYYHEQLYIASKNHIYQYDGKKFNPFYELPNKAAIIDYLHIQKDTMLIGTANQGLYVLKKQQQLTHPIPSGKICDLFRDSRGRYWIPTWEQGLYLLEGSSLSNFRTKENDPSTLSSDFAHKCCEDKQGTIWIGTFNGLNRYHEESRTFTRYTQSNKEKGLTHLSIWSMLCDSQGTIWLGTYFGGINYFHPANQIFHEYGTAVNGQPGLSSPIVGRMLEDQNNNLWICTDGGGLNKLDRKTGTFTWYQKGAGAQGLSHNNIKALYHDKKKNILWIGTHLGGLNKLDLNTERITHYTHQSNRPESLPSNIIRDIIPYKGQLILATNSGVCTFHPETGKSRPLFKSPSLPFQISTSIGLCIDHRGTLWIVGSAHGICSYNFDTGELKGYMHNHALSNSISSNTVNSVFEDSQKRLWLCTNENGLDLYHPDTDTFENFDKAQHGIASNIIYNICELSPDRFLLTTDNGFSIFDYPTKRFENFNKEEGFPLVPINENALYKTSDGELFIGGINGMVSFRPEELHCTPRSYRIHPYRLRVNGQEIEVGDPSGILKQSLTTTTEVILQPHQSVFSIEYAITDYIPFHKDDIIYRLEGFSEAWTSIQGGTNITYTNLNPGTYTLVVKARDNEKLIPESRLVIRVLPPFYRTLWAYFLYIVSATGLICYAVRAYKHRIKLQESLKYEKKHTENIERLNQTKLRFFTNISHEFRTPLTLIIGQMEMLLQVRSLVPVVYTKILSIYKSSLQLQELITELLDFRKQEQGYMSIKVSEHNLVDFAYENYLLFLEYALQMQITFHFRKSDEQLLAWYDAKQMQKVMNNLISNAFKHVKEHNEITVSIQRTEEGALIEVTDNGSGIAPEDIDKIFDRFYQTEQMDSLSYAGTGIGLSLTKGIVELHHGTISVTSEPNRQTTFSVRLKMGNKHFAPEQISDDKEEFLSNEGQKAIPETAGQELPAPMSSGKSRKAKILIVEDNRSLCEMLVKIFEPFYSVATACNGKEGWDKVLEEEPDIVLSDIVMPQMSGTELCKLIKGTIETCHIPVILLTARTAIEHNLEGLRLGADDYITKPFNINILLSRCNNLVNNRIMLQEKFSHQPQVTPQILATNVLDKDLMDKVTAIIDDHIDDPEFNVEVLTREMGIARTKLFTKLKGITGQTPADLIATIRLKRAALMLREHPELNISEISDRLGFSSPRQFTRSFKEKYHVIPQAYRNPLS